MHKEITAIIDGEVRILLLTDHEHGRIIHRSRNAPRRKIGSVHQFIIDITRMLKCHEVKDNSEASSEKQTEPTTEQ